MTKSIFWTALIVSTVAGAIVPALAVTGRLFIPIQ